MRNGKKMKFVQFLNEAPIETEFTRSEIKSMIDTYINIKKFNPETIKKYKGFDLVKFNKSSNSIRYALLDHDNKKVVFYSGLMKTSDGATQGVIWKDEDSKLNSMDLQKIFIDVMLNDIKFITSYDLQSPGGKSFWYKLTKRFLNSDKYEVGYTNRKKKIKFNPSKFEDEFETCYEEDLAHSKIYIKEL